MKTITINGHEIKMQANIGAMLQFEKMKKDPDVQQSDMLLTLALIVSLIHGADRHSEVTPEDITEWCDTREAWAALDAAASEEIKRFNNINEGPEESAGSASKGEA